MSEAKCNVPCPKCRTRCPKAEGHTDRDGIAGLCWCTPCDGWFVPGEATLIRDREKKQ